MNQETKQDMKGLGIAYFGMITLTVLMILDLYYHKNYFSEYAICSLFLLAPIIILNFIERRK